MFGSNLDHFEALLRPDTIGMLGVVLYAASYFLLATRRLSGESIWYYTLNLTAAGFVLMSLVANFHLASAMIQTLWILVSLFGIAVSYMERPQKVTIAITKRLGKVVRKRHKSVPVIETFFTESDRICIEVDGYRNNREHREIELTPITGGHGVDIWLDGNLVAHVENAETLNPSQVSLVPRSSGVSEGTVHWLTA